MKRPVTPPEAVLNVARHLCAGLHEADLDMIDGAFYWECCRPDFFAAAEAARGEFQDSQDEPRLLRQAFEISDAFHIPALAVWNRARHGVFVPLRTPDFGISSDHQFLWSRVFSGATTGKSFAESAHSFVCLAAMHTGSPFDTPPDRFAVHIDIEFEELSDSPAALRGDTGPGTHLAAIFVRSQLPLPSRESIASNFDRAMTENRSWHWRLPHAIPGKGKVIAIRTWAIGLLVGQGIMQFEGWMPNAKTRVCEELSISTDFKRQAHYQNLNRLVDRVPEAKPFLQARQGRPLSPRSRKCKAPRR